MLWTTLFIKVFPRLPYMVDTWLCVTVEGEITVT